ncbi:NB-ARC domain-containing protein [Amycolatopsis sp. cmx-4-83]|uniref:NB-ARC domain-containing protein n=1 Tax=Amycolatopsis sp. cmx-4-83 TaxID=2790940 RepID=UPI00397C37F9
MPFLDRVPPRQLIHEFLATRRDRERPGLVCVHARAGLGSYSLAAEVCEDHLAHDGAYVEVQATTVDGQAVPPGVLLGQALRGLGLAEPDLPASDTERAHAYQRKSAGRRFVLLVKDVVAAEQVEPLIPHAAPDAVVLVTSRRALRRLYPHGFLAVPLDGLPTEQARELMLTSLGQTAAQLEAALVDELCDLCDGHPLLIRLVAAHLLGRARAAEPLVARVRRSRAALLELDVAQPVASALKLAYDGLSDVHRRAYRRVSLIPGPGFTAAAAAIACHTDVLSAAELLDELVDACLLAFDEVTDRYAFHAVVREHARLRAFDDEDSDVRDAIVADIVEWYLLEAVPRDAALSGRWRVGDVFVAVRQPLPSRDDAIRWFEAEWQNLVACVSAAEHVERHEAAWQLCVALFKFLHMHGHTAAWLESHRLGLAAAERTGDLPAIMQVTNQRGAAWVAIGDYDAAKADFSASLAAAESAGHVLGKQSNLEWLGKVAARRGDFEEAFARYDESERVIETAGSAISADQSARMRALLNLQRARAHQQSDDAPAARGAATRALSWFAATGERENQAKCLLVLGELAEDSAAHREAAELFEADGLRRPAAEAWHRVGQRDADPAVLERARRLYAELGDRREDDVKADLDRLR